MTKLISIVCITALSLVTHTGLTESARHINWNSDTPLSIVLVTLGDQRPISRLKALPDKEQVKQGSEIVLHGTTTGPSGKKTERQSPYFVCTDCHNVKRENPNPGNNIASARLKYAAENGLPFLQGTPLYGAVNRDSWYNDDYLKMYGPVVQSARYNLMDAVQLCATKCSQGRALEKWELEAVLAYLWTLELKIGDLNLTKDELEKLYHAETGSTKIQTDLIKMLKSKYISVSHATFAEPLQPRKRGLGIVGNPANGEVIYKQGCMHCHKRKTITKTRLVDSISAYSVLYKNLSAETSFNVYHTVRKGTPNNVKPYMPLYTMEKMSDEQIEDLVAYIRHQVMEAKAERAASTSQDS